MLNETTVTLQGWMGGEVELRKAGDSVVASFRVACTPRRYRRSDDSWVDGPTQWYTVNAWRALGEHCAESLRRADPVVVHGRLNARTYVNKSGVEVLAHEVEAVLVGHDLTRGVSSFTRTPRPAATAGVLDAAPSEGHSHPHPHPQEAPGASAA